MRARARAVCVCFLSGEGGPVAVERGGGEDCSLHFTSSFVSAHTWCVVRACSHAIGWVHCISMTTPQ